MSYKVLSVFGTRPEAIKMSPVIRQLSSRTDEITSIVCVTAQHRQMLDQVLDLFDITPDYDLNLMLHNQTLAEITTGVMKKLDVIIGEVRPDWILVQGDTTTSMAASLAAYYQKVKIAHIEAGLRTWNKDKPFPEEVNRKIVDVVADLHFAPTEMSRENLIREGVPQDRIIITGNTVIDALLEVSNMTYDWNSGPLANIPPDKRLILVTAHRRENFGSPLIEICRALREIAEIYEDVHLVYPVHMNPNVRMTVHNEIAGVERISLIEPLEYLPFVHLMKASWLVLTDSGGLQEEAPSLGKPVLLMRDVTERPEAVAAGTVRIVGTERRNIVNEVSSLLDDADKYASMSSFINPYGDGQAAIRIVESLSETVAVSLAG